MNNTFDSMMASWVKMVNESNFSYNPDDSKTDDLDMMADQYEEMKNAMVEYTKTVDNGGSITGNLEDTDKNKAVTKESKVSADDILRKFNEKQKKFSSSVNDIDITDIYDGNVECVIHFNDGTTKSATFSISEDELVDTLKQLRDEVSEDMAKRIKLSDAAIALVRIRLDKDGEIDWALKPKHKSSKSSLDDWLLAKQIEDENELTNLKEEIPNVEDWDDQLNEVLDDEDDDEATDEISKDDFAASSGLNADDEGEYNYGDENYDPDRV